jgi:hypothetical protein
MAFVKQAAAKVTGADKAADEAKRAAEDQAAAVRAAGERAAKAAQDAAVQASKQMEMSAARTAAEGAAADALSKPVENADVQLNGPVDTTQSAAASARKRRQTFGVGSAASGVNI